jgi:hypothetical protein
MELLSASQIVWIQEEIRNKGITDPVLEDDLLDHICCIVEENVANGFSFEQAFDVVLEKFGPAGLRKIQTETTYLLNLNTTAHTCILALDYLMTFLLFIVSCCFVLSPVLAYLYQPTLFTFCISILFTLIGLIVIVSGFDYKNFDTVRTTSRIRIVKISIS